MRSAPFMGDDGRVLEVPAAFLVSYLSGRE
jgi:hypothetical protein